MKKVNSLAVSVSLIVTGLLGMLGNYLFLPALNIHSSGAWGFVILLTFIGTMLYSIITMFADTNYNRTGGYFKSLLIPGCIWLVYILLVLFGSVLTNARAYSMLIDDDISIYEWKNTVENKESVKDIALMDTDTAKVFGNRTLGSLSDIVSQYNVADTYTQINYQGRPMKVALLKYAGFWKWYSNHENGIPGYVIVDPVNSTGEYVKLSEPVRYSPSEFFGHDLMRTLRRQYPCDMFGDVFFEIDESGMPYFIAPVYTTTIGLFGGKVINDVIIFDAITGDSEKISVDEAPDWIDVIYDGDYLSTRLDWWGKYQGGFLNAFFAKTGCKQTTKDNDNSTADYGYITIGNDIWMYTGVTSLADDASNIAVVMGNERTGEVRYFEVAGADENSAMGAAEGEVQQYGYKASFPSLINVNNEPTYIMVLCDDNHIVKKYAMVNMNNYSKVVVEDTQAKVFAAYAEEMGFDVSPEVEAEAENEEPIAEVTWVDVTFVVDEVQFIVNNGNTTVYVSDVEGNYYKAKFDDVWILMKPQDVVNAKYNANDANDDIITITSVTRTTNPTLDSKGNRPMEQEEEQVVQVETGIDTVE